MKGGTQVGEAMVVTIDARADLDLAGYEAVAWSGATVELGPVAVARMRLSRGAFLELLDLDPEVVVYGVTSGYGQRAHLRFTPEERRAHARIPPVVPATAFGEPLPERVVRGIVLARLANFVEGHAAISPDLAVAVAAMLDGQPLPEVPSRGIGCPGEIQPLAHLFGDLLQKWPLAEKDGLALVNGSPCASALVADAVLVGRRRLTLATAVFTLAAEALAAPLEAYDPALDALFGDPDEAAVLVRLRELLAGGADQRRPYQAPVSTRGTIRQLTGARSGRPRKWRQLRSPQSRIIQSASRQNPITREGGCSRTAGTTMPGWHQLSMRLRRAPRISLCWRIVR